MSAKVELERQKVCAWFRNHPTCRQVALTHSLPFFRTAHGTYIHRVRSGSNHFTDGRYKHTSFRFWCGGGGSISDKDRVSGELLAAVPEKAVVCATCEGRAVGAGLVGSPVINGRPVCFSPRLRSVTTI